MSATGLLKQLEHQHLEDRMSICETINSDIFAAHSITVEESVIAFIILTVGMAVAFLTLLGEFLVKYSAKYCINFRKNLNLSLSRLPTTSI